MSTPKKTRPDGPASSDGGRITIPGIWQLVLQFSDLDTAFNFGVMVFSSPSLWDVAADNDTWGGLIEQHFGAKRMYYPTAWLPSTSCVPNFRAQKDFHPSDAYVEFCETYGERAMFSKVQIRQGDIGHIHDVDGTPLDGLMFPTNYSLLNTGSGAAAAVFRRAGADLDEYIKALPAQTHDTKTVVTPGFDAGVEHLIHCVGPSPHTIGSYPLLYQTYLSAFEQARRRHVKCIAVASISTGALGFPLNPATSLAMRALRDFIKTHRWNAKVAFVCWDADVAAAMRDAKADILANFNAQAYQVMSIV
ncbi:hypothetical protein H310_08363 [Aphanomyces invadans]|uniref:Macro domain-containing protein n=1 Tax=Aphanomyces invadans TaxID=157072 RepID=A0A024TY02_9STRA|nr:hypothetical protein H310_08363 [Aphanomyces invadans]ETV98864.1 hypothetical protein H310_08363 [Aphanomyces invadans]|eukprot:XP_008872292.1 hypothetical protein H310_08363 [Aphanomyces invadans]